MIHTIRTLYHTIHKHLRYTDTIQNFFHTIRYRVSYDTDNYGPDSNGHVLNSYFENFSLKNRLIILTFPPILGPKNDANHGY